MKRIHLFEFTDQSWYPDQFRQFQTDYLQFAASLGSGHENLVPIIKRALGGIQSNQIIDLCSGGSGPWMHLVDQLTTAGVSVTVTLTDKFPRQQYISRWVDSPHPNIHYLSDPVDALRVPRSLRGMRTMFEGFHHFKPEQAKSILEDAVKKRTAIGVFDASLKPPLGLLLLILSPIITCLTYFFVTPFIKPRSFARFFWTYLIPIVPLATSWDGVISLMRTYSPGELTDLVNAIDATDYTWEIGYASTGTLVFRFAYLVGYPRSV
jgi:hypothetical protein